MGLRGRYKGERIMSCRVLLTCDDGFRCRGGVWRVVLHARGVGVQMVQSMRTKAYEDAAI